MKDKVVWPNPEFSNLPAIDMLMFLTTLGTCVGFQMTVSRSHTLSLNRMNQAALGYFDSACWELKKRATTRLLPLLFRRASRHV
jgi:hypothetical protein